MRGSTYVHPGDPDGPLAPDPEEDDMRNSNAPALVRFIDASDIERVGTIVHSDDQHYWVREADRPHVAHVVPKSSVALYYGVR